MRAYVPDFEMSIAKDLSSALALMARGHRPFAGGTDIMVLFNAGKLAAEPLVNIRRLPELCQIAKYPDHIDIGAAVTYTQLRELSEFPLLAQAASWTGGIANQNRGTLGGNVANASPAADSSPVLLVHDAELKLVSTRAERWLPYANFHLGYKSLAILKDELITDIRMPYVQVTNHYGRKVGTRRAQAISKVSFAAGVFNGAVRIAVGSVAPIPMRCFQTEELLRDRITSAVISEAKATIRREISPIDDIRSTGDYRLKVTENLLGDFLETLL